MFTSIATEMLCHVSPYLLLMVTFLLSMQQEALEAAKKQVLTLCVNLAHVQQSLYLTRIS